jgi:hypothetical protein
MQSIAYLGLFLGALLGLRYSVLVLLPALVLCNGLIVTVGAGAGIGLGAIASIALTITIALQVGYFCGVLLRLAQILARAIRYRESVSMAASATAMPRR